MLVITYKSSYRKNGSAVFVGTVSSNNPDAKEAAKELKVYQDTKGAYLRIDEDTKRPLFFSSQPFEDGAELVRRRDGKDFYIASDLKDNAMFIQETALKMQGKLQGLLQFSGMSKKSFVESMGASLFA